MSYDWEYDDEYDPAALKAELYAAGGCLALVALLVAVVASGVGWLVWSWVLR